MNRKFLFIIDFILVGSLTLSAIYNIYIYSQLGSIRYETVIGVDNQSLELQMTIKNAIIKIGEKTDITLTLRNIGNRNITLLFTSSQVFDVLLYDCFNNLVSKWSNGKGRLPIIRNMTLEPNETYTESLDWKLYGQIPGNYYLLGVCMAEDYVHLGMSNMATSKLPVTIVTWYYPSILFVIISLISYLRYLGRKNGFAIQKERA